MEERRGFSYTAHIPERRRLKQCIQCRAFIQNVPDAIKDLLEMCGQKCTLGQDPHEDGRCVFYVEERQ